MSNTTPTPVSADDFDFLDAVVLGPDDVLFAAHHAASLAQDRYVTHLLRCRQGRWHELARWNFQAVALVVPATAPLRVEVLGRDGEVGVVDGDAVSQEVLETGRAIGPMRGLAVVFGRVLAHGMQRHVYVRDAAGAWIRFDSGMGRAPRQPGESISAYLRRGATADGGIDAVVAQAPDRLFAFGMRGEIWRFGGEAWVREDSPTDVMLKAAASAEDGTVWVCGLRGTLLTGRNGRWQVVDDLSPKGLDFCDVALFDGQVHVADGHALWRVEGTELKRVDGVPCTRLVSGHGTLLAVAGPSVRISRDGRAWTALVG